MRFTCLAAVALAGTMSSPLTAQTISAAGLQPGTRIRLDVQCGMEADQVPDWRRPSPDRRDQPESCVRHEGTLAWRTDDSVAITVDDGELVVPRVAINRMSAQIGGRGSTGIGALVGGGIGFGVGLASATGARCGSGAFEGLCQAGQITAPFAGAVIGAGIGALIGAFVRHDRWVTVSLR